MNQGRNKKEWIVTKVHPSFESQLKTHITPSLFLQAKKKPSPHKFTIIRTPLCGPIGSVTFLCRDMERIYARFSKNEDPSQLNQSVSWINCVLACPSFYAVAIAPPLPPILLISSLARYAFCLVRLHCH